MSKFSSACRKIGTFLAFSVGLPLAVPAQQAAPFLEACSILKASSVAPDLGGTPVDTSRIQSALNLCLPGQAVVLEKNGEQGNFLSTPLTLPRGVWLYLGAGTVLYASRHLRDYDLAPFRCGGQARSMASCKPFLFAYRAAYSGVDGPGVIDGQAEVLSAQDGKAWEKLVEEGAKRGEFVSSPDLVSSYESQGFSLNNVTLRHAAGVHASILKTTGFHSSGLRIDSPASFASSRGILLSNTVDSKLENTWIRVGGEALALKPSILGAASHITIDGLHIYGGKGVVFGDARYGDTRDIHLENVTIRDAEAGMVLNLQGTERGIPQNLHVGPMCMQQVKFPLRFDPIPSAEGRSPLVLKQAILSESGELHGDGSIGKESMSCDVPAFSSNEERVSLPSISLAPAPPVRNKLRVASDGRGDFLTVQEAINALPASGGEIAVAPGTYREVLTIRKPHVHLHGIDTDPAKAVLVFNHGPANGGTFASATVFVEADDVTIDHLTIQNDLGQGKGQAVALAALGDRGTFHHLRILGAQDTLYATAKLCYGDYGPCIPARQYFGKSYISGAVDFIFGDSKAVFDRCELHGIAGGNVMYTAQSKHYPEEESGYIVTQSKLTADAAAGTIALGRAWRPYSTVVFLNTEMDAPIVPAGWVEWMRFGQSTLETAYYAEYQSTGRGSSPKTREPRSHQLTEAEAQQWDPKKFLSGADGWNPFLKDLEK